MKYTTRLYGSPYGRDGERGEDTTAPLRTAKRVLHPGQRMDCFRASDDAQTTPIMRYSCDAAGKVDGGYL